MNIQRFVLPATLAAAFHAVLLMQGKVPVIITPNTGVTETPPESKTLTEDRLIEIPLPTEPNPEPEQKVSELAQGVELPQIEEIYAYKPKSDFRVEVENINPNKMKMDTKIIGRMGDPMGLPDGERVTQLFKHAAFLDKTPQATVRMPPTYPSAMRNDGIEGVVLVEFDVDVKGRVVGARVRESTDRAFEEPTLRAVLNWRFEPGLSQGRPVPFRMVIPVNFTLGAG